MRYVWLACAGALSALALAACDRSPSEPASALATWTFCPHTAGGLDAPIRVAFQDGDRPWRRVLPTGVNTYQFPLTQGVGGVAFVSQDPRTLGSTLQVLYGTAAELTPGPPPCAATKTIVVSARGFVAPTLVGVAGGGTLSTTVRSNEPFLLAPAKDGAIDLIAWREIQATFTGPPANGPTTVIVRRDQTIAAGGTAAPFDFASADTIHLDAVYLATNIPSDVGACP